jgi:hypothetical protein
VAILPAPKNPIFNLAAMPLSNRSAGFQKDKTEAHFDRIGKGFGVPASAGEVSARHVMVDISRLEEEGRFTG